MLADLYSKVIEKGMAKEDYCVEKSLNKQYSKIYARGDILEAEILRNMGKGG
jgi:hypothetical protein